jgi:hypothetical protein
MGFGKKSRREAKAAQEAAMRQQQAAYAAAQQQVQAYQQSSAARNAPIIALQKGSQDWMNRFNKGTDVADLNPAFAKNAQESADAVMNSMNYASNFGDTATHGGGADKNFQEKARSVAQRNIAKGVARLNMQGLENELQSNRGILMDTTNFLNSDARAGVGMSGDLFGMTNSIFNAATTKRKMEMERSNMMMQNMMGLISGGVQGFMAATGAGGMFGAGGAFGGSSGGGGNAMSGGGWGVV